MHDSKCTVLVKSATEKPHRFQVLIERMLSRFRRKYLNTSVEIQCSAKDL